MPSDHSAGRARPLFRLMEMPVPTDLPARRQPAQISRLGPIVVFSIVPSLISLLLIHYPAFANAFVLLGQMS